MSVFFNEQEKILKLLLDDFSNENFANYIEAAGRGMAVAFSFLKDEQEMEAGLRLVFEAIRGQAMHNRLQNDQDPITADQFLREHFNPGEFNG